MNRSLVLTILVFCSLNSIQSNAEPVQTKFKGMILNGQLEIPVDVDRSSTPFFLIVHGTWAHAGMEIIKTIQQLLLENNLPSLAINLSLGISDRVGFLGCDQPITANHSAAVGEIKHWFDLSRTQGWKNITLVGHSRGGSQVALFLDSYPHIEISTQVLIAPATWDKEQLAQSYQKSFSQSLVEALIKAGKEPERLMRSTSILNCRQADVLASSFLSYYGPEPEKNTPELLSRTSYKTIVYLGSEDPISRKIKVQNALFKTNSLVESYTIQGAGHFFRDLYSDDLIEDLLTRIDL